MGRKIIRWASCSGVTWPSVAAAGSRPPCDLMLSVMSTSFALIVKECSGGFIEIRFLVWTHWLHFEFLSRLSANVDVMLEGTAKWVEAGVCFYSPLLTLTSLHVGLEPHMETLKTLWWVETRRKVGWEPADSGWRNSSCHPWKPQENVWTVRFHFANFIFFVWKAFCCDEFQRWPFLWDFLPIKAALGTTMMIMMMSTDRRVDDPECDVGFTNFRWSSSR